MQRLIRQFSYRFICGMLLLSGTASPASAERTIVIIRHAEKPNQGLGQLSCRGLNRSLALAPMLLERYGRPIAIYAPNPAIKKNDNGIAYAYVRPLATIEPLAISAGLPVTLDWGMSDTEPLARMILAKANGTQIIAWEHHWAETLARQLLSKLGEDPTVVPTWGDSDFDGIFVIRGIKDAQNKEQITFSREAETLPDLSDQCPHQRAIAPQSNNR